MDTQTAPVEIPRRETAPPKSAPRKVAPKRTARGEAARREPAPVVEIAASARIISPPHTVGSARPPARPARTLVLGDSAPPGSPSALPLSGGFTSGGPVSGGGVPGAGRPLALRLPRARTGRLIAAFAPWLASGNTVFCLDGGNAFNPYHLARRLRAQGGAADEAFEERLFVSRAWTCHQFAFAVEEMLPPLLARRPVPLVALLGIETMFLDEDIALFERRHLFERILARTARLCGEGLPVLITCGESETPWSRRIGRCARIAADPEPVLRMLEGGGRDDLEAAAPGADDSETDDPGPEETERA